MFIFLMKGEDTPLYMHLLSPIPKILPLSSDARASTFSDAFARVESRFSHFQSVIHDPEARVAAVSAVDKEIDAVMHLLHSLRNAMAPISVLPPRFSPESSTLFPSTAFHPWNVPQHRT